MHDVTERRLSERLSTIRSAGSLKLERAITTPQGTQIRAGSKTLVNFCSNDYLGLANHPDVVKAARQALDNWGFGLASVRFISGTQSVHLELERQVSQLLGTEDTILYSSCFDANSGLFEALFDENDVIISDELNHASLIDGIRLSKARRLAYRNRDMAHLQERLDTTEDARLRVIVTDGVFSMDGSYAPLAEICQLAEEHGAVTIVDDSHGVGVVGKHGAGTSSLADVADRVDIVTGTFGKALGGGSGGYVSSNQIVIDLLRQTSRPYLFSNSIPPALALGASAAIDLASVNNDGRQRLQANSALLRTLLQDGGFEVLPGKHPITAVMFRDAHKSVAIAETMYERGVYVRAFSYPVVPHGQARIRVQLSAAHTDSDIFACAEAFRFAQRSLALAPL